MFAGENEFTTKVNLSHVMSLVDSLEVDGNSIAYIWIYSEAPDYKPVAAPGEGIACVDDVGRLMEVLEFEISNHNRSDLRPLALMLTEFLLYMSRDDGLWNNFIYQDGRVNTTHRNSRAEFGWWAVRGLRGLAAANNIFWNDEKISRKIQRRIRAVEPRIQQALSPYPGLINTKLGNRPTWLVANAPDMNSELLLALAKLHNSNQFDYFEYIEKIAQGIVGYQYNSPEDSTRGMYFCWDNIWHNWGNNQAYALLEAYKITGDTTLLQSVEMWADFFIPFLLTKRFPRQIEFADSGEQKIIQFPQIAYGITSSYRGLLSLAEITENEKYRKYAEEIFTWYTGNNSAHAVMFDSVTGRCYDGINSKTAVNLNSGAESNIEYILAEQFKELHDK